MELSTAHAPNLPNLTLLDFVTPLSLLLRKDWARQFLLQSTPESDLAVLTSKNHQNHALVGELRNRVTKNQTDSVAQSMSPGVNSFFNANWAIIPAFNVDRYSALIFIKEETSNWDQSLFAQHMPQPNNGRNKLVHGILDNATGTTVGCSMDEQFFYSMVMHRKLNTRSRHRGFLRVPKKVLLANDIPTIISCIPMFIHTSEAFLCSLCPSGICMCPQFEWVQPKFALDLTTTGKNMMKQVGTYTGYVRSSMNAHHGLAPNLAKTTSIFGEIVGGNVPGTLPRLLTWGITQLLSRALSNSSPSKTPFPLDIAIAAQAAIGEQLKLLSSEQQRANNQVADSTMFTCSEPFLNGTTTEQSSLPFSSNGFTHSNGEIMNEAHLDQALGISNGSKSNSNVSSTQGGPQTERSIMSEFDRVLDIAPPITPNDQLDMHPNATNILLNSSLASTSNQHNSNHSGSTTDMLHARPTATGDQLNTHPPTVSNPLNAYPTRANGQINGHPAQTSVPIQPFPLPQPTAMPPQVPLDDSPAARAHRRKLRNRESAARSNLKKQQRAAELKRQISEAHKRQTTLECRLKELRAENQDLLKRISS